MMLHCIRAKCQVELICSFRECPLLPFPLKSNSHFREASPRRFFVGPVFGTLAPSEGRRQKVAGAIFERVREINADIALER
jgi:hypothetical protein